MKKTIYFLSGLPRSGTTLLSNILAQNPRFHATQTSGCLDVLFAIRNQWTHIIEHKAHPCPQKLTNVLKAAFEGYYADVDNPIVIDKSRGWLVYIEFIENIMDKKAKILVPIRPIPEILASFEVLYRETSKVRQPPGEAENYFQFQTVKGRCDYWMHPNQVVGISVNRLKDAFSRGLQDRMFFIDFDSLTRHPAQMIDRIYDFLGECYYPHNFNHVEQVTTEDDEVHGFVNLHKIRNKVQPVQNKAIEILGKDVVDSFSNLSLG